MKLNDVLGLLKADEITNKTITISVDENGEVAGFSLHDGQKTHEQTLGTRLSDFLGPYNAPQPWKEPYKVTL